MPTTFFARAHNIMEKKIIGKKWHLRGYDIMLFSGLVGFSAILGYLAYVAGSNAGKGYRPTVDPLALRDSFCSVDVLINDNVCAPDYFQTFMQTCLYAVNNATDITSAAYKNMMQCMTLENNMPQMTKLCRQSIIDLCYFPGPIPAYPACTSVHVLTCMDNFWAAFSAFYKESIEVSGVMTLVDDVASVSATTLALLLGLLVNALILVTAGFRNKFLAKNDIVEIEGDDTSKGYYTPLSGLK